MVNPLYFNGRKVLIATKHQKESVIGPALKKAFGLEYIISEGLDTDVLGTFTGEIERTKSPMEAARQKCNLGMDLSGADLAIGSEGSFGPHPDFFFVPAGEEIMVFKDRKNDLEISAKMVTQQTNYSSLTVTPETNLDAFLSHVLFPSHGLILKKSMHDHTMMDKGIHDESRLKKQIREYLDSHGSCYLETDMRAMHNPTRMRVIAELTDDRLYFNDGEILANQPEALEKIFARAETVVALHSEDEGIIRQNYQHYVAQTQGNIHMRLHAKIRSTEACVEATQRVLAIQAKYQNRLHFFHISTGQEAMLFPLATDPKKKRVTSEACVHHLWFEESAYESLGGKIKWNPSIKTEEDRRLLIQALSEGRIDIIASDHAPHTKDEKMGTYDQIKSGAPIVQHTLPILFELANRGELSIEQIVEKTSHRVADIYRMVNRGYIREGYFADLVEVDAKCPWQVTPESLHYKCAWSPVEDEIFQAKVKRTFVNGNLLFENDKFVSNAKGMRLLFEKIR